MGGMVTIFDPQGNAGEIPQENLAAAVKAGAMPAVHMQSPDGSLGYVPANRSQDAVKAGAKILPFEQQEVTHPGFWAHLLDDAWSMAKGVVNAGPTAASGDEIHNQAEYQQKLISEGRSLPYRALMSLTPDVMRERAESGDVGGVASQTAALEATAASPLATSATAPFAARMADAVSGTPEAFAARAKAVSTAPIRASARAAEAVVNAKLKPFSSLMTPADEAAAKPIKIPGRDYGLSSPQVPTTPNAPVETAQTPQVATVDPLLQRIRNIAANIQQEDAEEAAQSAKNDDLTSILEKSVRRVKAAKKVANPTQPIVPAGVDDLTDLLQESLRQAQAAKGQTQ